MARIHRISTYRTVSLEQGWQCASSKASSLEGPTALPLASLAWIDAPVPGTAAAALRAASQWDFKHPRDFDADDWWYRTTFATPEPVGEGKASSAHDAPVFLCFDGLATLCEIWVNGQLIARSDNMFHEHAVDISALLRRDQHSDEPSETGINELVLCFRSLNAALGARRPRPRWRTRLVDKQQLRAFRTTLLGRIPGWTPPVAAVGPWRPIRLEQRRRITVEKLDLTTRVEDRAGIVRVALTVQPQAGYRVSHAILLFAGREHELHEQQQTTFQGEAREDDVPLWWPHTHGEPQLHPVSLRLKLQPLPPGAHGDAGSSVETVNIDCGKVGFRSLEVDRSNDGFALSVNGVPVFCRGACWTTQDIVTLGGTANDYGGSLELARAAGMNMLRVGGTMVYEHDRFYEACDALGILVWQDFMFANMDYPAEDPLFLASVQREARTFLNRVQGSPALAVLCGNSEIEQQTAMLGLTRDLWSGPLFQETLPSLAREQRPDVVYCPSSPTGGALPFQVDAGVSHYYGVGAYLRPLEDARRAGVRFTSECLGFSNIPEERTIDLVVEDGQSPFHHPAWKARVPRDSGPGWDFEDVRDHYLRLLFGVDPVSVRYADMDRYLALSRVTTAEVMAATIGEWRRTNSHCRGALVWFYRDLWPGAGWGVIDSTGTPKAAYYGLKRAQRPIAVVLSDEGLNGLEIHLLNETEASVRVVLRVVLYRQGEVAVAESKSERTLPPRSRESLRADAMFDHFVDATYAYRFGPPSHDVTVVTLSCAKTGRVFSEASHFPLGWSRTREVDLGLEAWAISHPTGGFDLTVRARKFAQSLAIQVRDYLPEDNYFHLPPGSQRVIHLRPMGGARPLQGSVLPLNGIGGTKIASRAPDGPPARDPQ